MLCVLGASGVLRAGARPQRQGAVRARPTLAPGRSTAGWVKRPTRVGATAQQTWVLPKGWTEDGLAMLSVDPHLEGFEAHLKYQWKHFVDTLSNIETYEQSLEEFAAGYKKFGFSKKADGTIVFREWCPPAAEAWLVGEFNDWKGEPMTRDQFGVWSCELPPGAIPHDSLVKIRIRHHDGWTVDRFPAWIQRAKQLPGNVLYDSVYWDPPQSEIYRFKNSRPPRSKSLRIYESHVGMSGEEERVHTYREFADDILPRVKDLGYNAVQLMAVMEHVYYGSFGYHVTSPFAVSSRSGTPDDLKYLVDKAHGMGIRVLLDVVHSHISKNTEDGLAGLDLGQAEQDNYFLNGARGYHSLWDSRLFNYSNWEVLRYLLSNVRFWLEEFQFDGFRFDGVTSMLYHHHGINVGFSGNYKEYFSPSTNVEAVTYLMLANELAHRLVPDAVTIAEDVSGMPGLCRPVSEGGVGFDYRLGMAIPDHWIKILKHVKDEDWRMIDLVSSLCNRRYTEKTVAYAESHDQALVGDKTIAMWLFDKEIYDGMSALVEPSPVVQRGLALHMMIRAITMSIGGEAWLCFMGNEFGHPEWLDFPREGNGWSFKFCRRQWSLVDSGHLRYTHLREWDKALMALDEKTGFSSDPHQVVSTIDEERKVIVAERGPLIFVFNFNTKTDFTGLEIGVGTPGKYRVVMDNSEWRFGGAGLIAHDADHFTQPEELNGRPCRMSVFSPARSAVVYANADVWGDDFWGYKGGQVSSTQPNVAQGPDATGAFASNASGARDPQWGVSDGATAEMQGGAMGSVAGAAGAMAAGMTHAAPAESALGWSPVTGSHIVKDAASGGPAAPSAPDAGLTSGAPPTESPEGPGAVSGVEALERDEVRPMRFLVSMSAEELLGEGPSLEEATWRDVAWGAEHEPGAGGVGAWGAREGGSKEPANAETMGHMQRALDDLDAMAMEGEERGGGAEGAVWGGEAAGAGAWEGGVEGHSSGAGKWERVLWASEDSHNASEGAVDDEEESLGVAAAFVAGSLEAEEVEAVLTEAQAEELAALVSQMAADAAKALTTGEDSDSHGYDHSHGYGQRLSVDHGDSHDHSHSHAYGHDHSHAYGNHEHSFDHGDAHSYVHASGDGHSYVHAGGDAHSYGHAGGDGGEYEYSHHNGAWGAEVGAETEAVPLPTFSHSGAWDGSAVAWAGNGAEAWAGNGAEAEHGSAMAWAESDAEAAHGSGVAWAGNGAEGAHGNVGAWAESGAEAAHGSAVEWAESGAETAHTSAAAWAGSGAEGAEASAPAMAWDASAVTEDASSPMWEAPAYAAGEVDPVAAWGHQEVTHDATGQVAVDVNNNGAHAAEHEHTQGHHDAKGASSGGRVPAGRLTTSGHIYFSFQDLSSAGYIELH